MKAVFLLLCIFVAKSLFAQPDIFEVEGIGNREIEPSNRLISSPKIIDSLKVSTVNQQPLLQLYQETKIDLDTIEAATVETTEKIKKLYPFYAKLGIGSIVMPLGELYFNSTRSRSVMYGAHLKHLSSFGQIKGRDKLIYAPASFDKTSALVFGKVIKSNFTLGGDINYENHGYHYYGIANQTIDADSIRQRIQRTGFGLNLTTDRGDSAILNFKFDIDYNNLTSQKPMEGSFLDGRVLENHFDFKTMTWYNKGKEHFYTGFDVCYNGYKYERADSSIYQNDTSLMMNNTIINLSPGIVTSFLDKALAIDVGVGISVDIKANTRAYIYPRINVSYNLLDGLLVPYIGIRGGLKQTTFGSINESNPYSLTNVSLSNENTAYDLFFGVRGGISKRLTYSVNASFAHVKNMAFFITDTAYSSLNNRFNVIYDTLNLSTVEASISYQLSEKLKIDGLGRFYNYEMKNEARAWNLPQLQFVLRGTYNLYDKFYVRADLTMGGGRMAKVYGPGDGIMNENNQYVKPLGFLADGNLGFEYRYNTRVSAFLQVNNVASQRYSRWLNYPVMPIQILGGISARF
jgi:hypothetical protein